MNDAHYSCLPCARQICRQFGREVACEAKTSMTEGLLPGKSVTAEQRRFTFMPDNPSVTRRARDSSLYTREPNGRDGLGEGAFSRIAGAEAACRLARRIAFCFVRAPVFACRGFDPPCSRCSETRPNKKPPYPYRAAFCLVLL